MLQLIPARGRKLDLLQLGRIVVLVATYPREGTETPVKILHQFQQISLQLIPARGRKPAPSFPARRIQTLQLIPARGRKHRVRSHHGEIAAVATYPREGTETGCSIPSQSHCSRCNLSPRGDRNLLSLKDKIGYNEATGISPKRRNAYTDLCANFLHLPR